MNIIFTDIDGVLNTVNRNDWNKNSIDLYNKLCKEFDLKAVISSTWRLNHTKSQLQNIFNEKGVEVEIIDFTDSFPDEGRGREIEDWIFNNSHSKFIIIDDSVRDIIAWGLPNVVRCRGWIGFSQEEYELARELLLKTN
jgi:hypothetical protein